MTKIADSLEDGISELDKARLFAKNMLKTILFVGTYQEKRYVETLQSYRDVVKIEADEKELIENLGAVKRKLDKCLVKGKWIGLTEPETVGAPAGYCLWVILQQEVFGKYWYKIKNVEFLENEIRLKLGIVRPFTRESTPVANISIHSQNGDVSQSILDNINGAFMLSKMKTLNFFKEVLTYSNIKYGIIFTSLLVATIVTGGIEIIKYLMEYLLRLLRELSGIIKVSSPIIISFMNVILRTIYGFYKLIFSLFRKPQQNVFIYPSDHNYIEPVSYSYSSQRYLRSLPSLRSSVRITPIDD